VAAKTADAFPGLRRQFPKTYLAYKGAAFLYRNRKKALALGASLFMASRYADSAYKRARVDRLNARRSGARQNLLGRFAMVKPRLAGGEHIGAYKGRLPKPKRASKPGKYALYGARAEVEKHGTQSLNNVVYLGAQSAPATRMGDIVGQAFIRKVMRRHYLMEYAHPASQLFPATSGANNTAPRELRFLNKITPASGVPTYTVAATFVFTTTDTLLTFGTWFSSNVFNSSAFGGSPDAAYFTNELYAYQFVNLDLATPNVTVYLPIIPLENQYLTVYSTVAMHIQNVTTADDPVAVQADTIKLGDRIDANPLKGKLMVFRGSTPKLSSYRGIATTTAITPVPEDNAYILQTDSTPDGIFMPAVSLTGVWQQVPLASQFSNCKGEVSVNLEPGQMKNYSIQFRYSGTLQRLIRGFSQKTVLGQPLPNGVHSFGESFLFALEKRMPTGNAQCTLNFHYEQYYGALFGRRKVLPMARQADAGSATVPDVI